MRLTAPLLMLLLCTTPALAKGVYKWVDANGKVQYSDSPPMQIQQAGVESMNKQGRLNEFQPSAAAIQQRKLDEANAKLGSEQARLAARRDRALLESYRSSADIEKKRDERLATLQPGLDALLKQHKQQQQRVAELEKEAGAKPNPAQLSNISVAKSQLNSTKLQLAAKQKEIEQVKTQAGNDIKRFQELKNLTPTTTSAPSR